jgi:hypothetical protein
MLIFWHNGGIKIEPETEAEATALDLVFQNLRRDVPPILKAGSPERIAADAALEQMMREEAEAEAPEDEPSAGRESSGTVFRMRIRLTEA